MAPDTRAPETPRRDSRSKLLDAALYLIRGRGYAATRVEDICAQAGLSKGSFFHHFASKEDLAIAAAEYFETMAEGLFSQAPYQRESDPTKRFLGYVDFRREIIAGELPDFTCLLGTMVQETYDTAPAIVQACDKQMSAHLATLVPDITEAKADHAPEADWTPESMALFTQAVLQGAFILAKAKHNPAIARDCVKHLQRYLETEFNTVTPVRQAVSPAVLPENSSPG